MSNIFRWAIIIVVFWLGADLVERQLHPMFGPVAGLRAAEGSRSTPIRLLVPSGAEVRVDGVKVGKAARDEERTFRTPELDQTKFYSYSVEICYNGHCVQKTIRFTPGMAIEIDFRPEFRERDKEEEATKSPFKPLRRREPKILRA
jgi:hypothetical protein